MDRELIDRAWRVLPAEFKEDVKKYYRTLHEQYKEYDGLHFETAKAKVKERIVTLEYFFGKHNLTSDAEGEEMLFRNIEFISHKVKYEICKVSNLTHNVGLVKTFDFGREQNRTPSV